MEALGRPSFGEIGPLDRTIGDFELRWWHVASVDLDAVLFEAVDRDENGEVEVVEAIGEPHWFVLSVVVPPCATTLFNN
jgi:hypothetical protein